MEIKIVFSIFVIACLINVTISEFKTYLGRLDDLEIIENTMDLIIQVIRDFETNLEVDDFEMDENMNESDPTSAVGNMENITLLLNSISKEIQDFRPDYEKNENYRIVNDFRSELLIDRLNQIEMVHADSMKLRSFSENDCKRCTNVESEDFISSVFYGSPGGIASILNSIPSLLEKSIFDYQKQQYGNCEAVAAFCGLELSAITYFRYIHWPVIIAEIKGFITITRGYLIRNEFGEGIISDALEKFKEKSIQRIDEYLKAASYNRIMQKPIINNCEAIRWPSWVLTNGSGVYKDLYPISSGKIMVFVQAEHDACISLASGPDVDYFVFEICFGVRHDSGLNVTWENGTQIFSDDEAFLLGLYNYKRFIITIDHSVTVQVNDRYDHPYSINGKNLKTITHFAVTTKNGASGEWIIRDLYAVSDAFKPTINPPLRWCHVSSSGDVPPCALKFEDEREGNRICRIRLTLLPSGIDSFLIGTLRPNSNRCEVTDSRYSKATSYDVLSGDQVQWIPMGDRINIPADAIIIANDSVKSRDYKVICRAYHNDTEYFGSRYLNSWSFVGCSIEVSNEKINIPKHDVLVYSRI